MAENEQQFTKEDLSSLSQKYGPMAVHVMYFLKGQLDMHRTTFTYEKALSAAKRLQTQLEIVIAELESHTTDSQDTE